MRIFEIKGLVDLLLPDASPQKGQSLGQTSKDYQQSGPVAIGETPTDLELKHCCNETLKRKADTLAVRKESFGTRRDHDFCIGWGQQYVKFINKLSQ